MTVAALDAAALDACLRELRAGAPGGDLAGLGRRFQERLARTVAAPWLVATGEDLRYPTTEGGRPSPATRLVQRYVDRVVAVATEDPRVFEAFSDVVNMLAPPSRLFRPGVLLRVLDGVREPPLVEPPAAEAGRAAARAPVRTGAAAVDGRLGAVDR